MSIYDKIRQLENERSITIRLLVPDMTTMEDYSIIAAELRKYNGIQAIGPYTNNNILKISYSPSSLSLDTIDYVISRLGYSQNIKKKGFYQAEPKRKGG
ncbi:hypothetical protein [Natronincola ferrireducens]|uniref:HMA domain-containing protein n=1 Tax=Natronincola ferrireducens TaxID=393762 RepID=A0A1G9CSK9_9FIRM|nr:hypothetical protein [Natronincola ferrireducens]SDK54632.1 hypothetical protein SAMN05660472_01545 [Natronincola ferrireducens]